MKFVRIYEYTPEQFSKLTLVPKNISPDDSKIRSKINVMIEGNFKIELLV